MEDWLRHLILFGTGSIAGALNVVAGGGSFLTLPILIFLGLPANAANHTNRIGIILQNIGAVWSFNRHQVLDWRFLGWAAMPATLGAILGAWGALHISDLAFQRLLVFLMVTISIWTLWNPLKKIHSSSSSLRGARTAASFFLVGAYGGFIQAGVGFFLLAATTLAGLDLVRGNAVKVLCALCFTTASLAIFAWKGEVYWLEGLSLGAGTLLGGLVGVHLTVLKGHRWIKAVVTTTVILFAIKLWLSG